MQCYFVDVEVVKHLKTLRTMLFCGFWSRQAPQNTAYNTILLILRSSSTSEHCVQSYFLDFEVVKHLKTRRTMLFYWFWGVFLSFLRPFYSQNRASGVSHQRAAGTPKRGQGRLEAKSYRFDEELQSQNTPSENIFSRAHVMQTLQLLDSILTIQMHQKWRKGSRWNGFDYKNAATVTKRVPQRGPFWTPFLQPRRFPERSPQKWRKGSRHANPTVVRFDCD